MVDFNERISQSANLVPLWETILDLNIDIAELNYANSLNADNREQLFVDPFVDQSKIQSSSQLNISTGQNGNIEVADREKVNDNIYFGTSSEQGSGIATVEIDIHNEPMIISSVGCAIDSGQAGGQDGTLDIEIYKNGSVVASGSTNISNTGYYTASVSFSESDFSENLTNSDTVEIHASANVQYGDFAVINETAPIESDKGDFTLETIDDGINDITSQRTGKYSEGTLTSIQIDKGYTPSSIQVDADKETDSETSISARVFDGNGNEVTISEEKLGEKINASFSDQKIQAEIQLNTSNPAKTPKINDYGLRVIE